MRDYYGYSQPVLERYLTQLGNYAQGNFGYSISTGQTVLQRIGEVWRPTLIIASLGIALATVIGLAVAATASLTPFGWLAAAVRALPPVFSSAPAFLVGVLILQIFGVQLGLVRLTPDGSFLSSFFPALTIAIPLSAPIAQVLLASVDEVRNELFVRNLRSKGFSETHIFWAHLVRIAGPPTITVFGLALAHVVTGTVVVETVFSRAGLGRVIVKAVSGQDLQLLGGLILLVATIYVVVNILIELLYPLLDPRIRTAARP
ncbi:ABC transporter permease [Pseudochelatococcus sp. B33]